MKPLVNKAARWAGAVGLGLIVAATPVSKGQAQTLPDTATPPPSRLTLLRAVGRSCSADFLTLCTPPSTGMTTSQDELTCLKFVKSDVSLACRHAIVAASQ